MPYCVKFNPDEDKQHLFVAGTSDKKIVCVSHGLAILNYFYEQMSDILPSFTIQNKNIFQFMILMENSILIARTKNFHGLL